MGGRKDGGKAASSGSTALTACGRRSPKGTAGVGEVKLVGTQERAPETGRELAAMRAAYYYRLGGMNIDRSFV
jgi:hypothetical protein